MLLEFYIQYHIFLKGNMAEPIKNKTVLLTGGTGALGCVVAARFIREGANVATSYRSAIELKRLPPEVKQSMLSIRANVADEKEVAGLFKEVGRRVGRVDILINLAGGFLPPSGIRDLKTKDWDHLMSTNLRSVFLCARAFLKQSGNDRYGRIISMAAASALRPSPGRGPYAVSKSGVVVLTQVLGEELKGKGITANAIAPSIIRTEANLRSMPDEDSSKWVNPEDIAEMMVFLCSDAAEAINGTCIPILGGLS